MTEERITEVEGPSGTTHSHTVVINDEPKSSQISGWFVMFLVLLAVVLGVWAFSQMGGAETAKDNAIADAANKVGQAADSVGNAAESASEAVQETVK